MVWGDIFLTGRTDGNPLTFTWFINVDLHFVPYVPYIGGGFVLTTQDHTDVVRNT